MSEGNELIDNSTPEGIKTSRERCNTIGMDLQSDVGISMQRLTPGKVNVKNDGIESEECEMQSA